MSNILFDVPANLRLYPWRLSLSAKLSQISFRFRGMPSLAFFHADSIFAEAHFSIIIIIIIIKAPPLCWIFSVFGTQSGRGKLFLFPITHSHHTPNKLNFPFCWDLFTILATSLSFRLTTQESSQSDFGWTSEMRIIRRKVFAIEIIPNLFWEESVCEI